MVKLPALKIRYKILLFMVALLIFALITYALLATRLFNEDKTAYIYETNALLVETLAADIETNLTATAQTLRQIADTIVQTGNADDKARFVRSLFENDKQLVEVMVLPLGGGARQLASSNPLLHVFKLDYLKLYELDRDFLTKLRNERPAPLARLGDDDIVFQDATLPGGAPLVGLYFKAPGIDPQSSHLVVGHIRKDRLISLFSRSQVYTSYLIDPFGTTIAQTSHEDSSRSVIDPKYFVRDILKTEFPNGAKDFADDEGNQFIGAFKRLDFGNLMVFSYISKDKAFLAAKRLVEKTVFFGVIILLASVIFSILFSRRLTAALNKLYSATQRISKGEFDLKTDVRSRDEVGALSKAFDRMAQEIKRLLVQTHEKALIEKEIETARTVQDNLFPHENFRTSSFQLTGYYAPASSCGGDWWGYMPFKNQLVVLIGDATGHGVPSALVTAAAQSCCTTLRYLGTRYENLLLSPAQIMNNLNTAVYFAAKGHIKMTFFVSVIDLQAGMMRYANASHEMPMVSRVSSDGSREKKNLTALTGDPGPALGDKPHTTYQQHEYQLLPGDVILWYTDGLTEYRNRTSQKEWGENRLLRTLIKCANQSVDDIKNHVISTAAEFGEHSAADDDMTLVIGKVNENVAFGHGAQSTQAL